MIAPARKDVLSIEREVFHAKGIGIISGMAPNPLCQASSERTAWRGTIHDGASLVERQHVPGKLLIT